MGLARRSTSSSQHVGNGSFSDGDRVRQALASAPIALNSLGNPIRAASDEVPAEQPHALPPQPPTATLSPSPFLRVFPSEKPQQVLHPRLG